MQDVFGDTSVVTCSWVCRGMSSAGLFWRGEQVLFLHLIYRIEAVADVESDSIARCVYVVAELRHALPFPVASRTSGWQVAGRARLARKGMTRNGERGTFSLSRLRRGSLSASHQCVFTSGPFRSYGLIVVVTFGESVEQRRCGPHEQFLAAANLRESNLSPGW